MQDFGGENMRERENWQDLSIDGKNNIKTDFKEIGCDGVYWTDLAQDRENLHTAVKMEVTYPVP